MTRMEELREKLNRREATAEEWAEYQDLVKKALSHPPDRMERNFRQDGPSGH